MVARSQSRQPRPAAVQPIAVKPARQLAGQPADPGSRARAQHRAAWERTVRALGDLGYTPGAPERAYEIDREVAESWPCGACARRRVRQSREYRPFQKSFPYSYIAYAICPRCYDAKEF